MSGCEVKIAPQNLAGTELYNWIYYSTTNLQEVIISIDGLGYGGLLESRKLDLTEYQVIERLSGITALKNDPYFQDVTITAFNSILRLAPNVLSSSELAMYNNIRDWAILKDKVDNFGMNTSANLAELSRLETAIGATRLKQYKDTRARNLEINKQVLQWVSQGYIDELILPQDDANEYGLHRADREVLKTQISSLGISKRVFVYPGVDETTSLLVARAATRKFNYTPRIYVHYTNPTQEKNWIAEFEDIGLHENIRLHVESMGGVLEESITNANTVLYIHTHLSNTDALINSIKSQSKPSLLITYGYTSYGLIDKLRGQMDITKLLAYSGWNTVGNAIGVGIAQAAIRYAATTKSYVLTVEERKQALQAHIEFTLQRYYEDYLYSDLRSWKFSPYVSEIGGDSLNLGTKTAQVEALVEKELRPRAASLFHCHFAGKVLSTGSESYRIEKGVIPRINLPWKRLFEVGIYPQVQLSTNTNPTFSYSDVNSTSHPYSYESIIRLKRQGIFPAAETAFYPNAQLIRGGMAGLICDVLQIELGKSPDPKFDDVPSWHWAYNVAAAVKHYGLMNGTATNKFEPDTTLNRASIAKMIAESFGFMHYAGKVSDYFVDTNDVSWAKEHINILAYLGVASVSAEKKFYPNMTTTREQAATFIDRAIRTLEDQVTSGKL
ncbi:S-layer domain-containing protein [Bacillus phage PBC6]|nr:S-layer domain-containing protein [Bacillus phage PBC6]